MIKRRYQGRRNWWAGGAAAPHCPLPGGARGAKVPFNLKDCLGEIANCQKLLVQLFYEFASENARNAVIELQE
jgi:hypothetical protein